MKKALAEILTTVFAVVLYGIFYSLMVSVDNALAQRYAVEAPVIDGYFNAITLAIPFILAVAVIWIKYIVSRKEDKKGAE